MANMIQRAATAVAEAWIPGVQTGGWNPEFVPSTARLDQLEQYALDGGSFDQSAFGLGIGQSILPFRSPIVVRCVSLLSALIAQLVTGGGLRVVNTVSGEGVPATNSASSVGRAMSLLTESPDGMQHAYGFVESCAADQLFYGNALIRAPRGASVVSSLHRQAISDAGTQQTSDGTDFIWFTRDWENPTGQTRPVPRQEMIHSYWGSLLPPTVSSNRGRAFLALPPIGLMRKAVQAGIEGERYVLEYFYSGAGQAPYAITYAGNMTAEQKLEAGEAFYRRRGRRALVLGKNAKVTQLNGEPQREGTLRLREFQVEEVARLWGIPTPLVGQAASTWGSGIAELGRFAYRFGLQQHLDRFLAGLSQRLLPGGYGFEIDPISLVRADPAALTGFIQAGLGGPNNPAWMTRNEARKWSNLPREPDGEYETYEPQGGQPALEMQNA